MHFLIVNNLHFLIVNNLHFLTHVIYLTQPQIEYPPIDDVAYGSGTSRYGLILHVV